MKIVIENTRPEHFHKTVQYLKRDLSQSLDITEVKIEPEWIQIGGDDVFRQEELRNVITFDLNPFPDDHAMQALTTAFEGTNLVFSVPNIPGFRWTIG